MAFESLTDAALKALADCPKQVTNPQARRVTKSGHEQLNYTVKAADNSGHEFQIYTRQNRRPGMEDDFSCGINWLAPNGEVLILGRYNGPAHSHLNSLEGKRLAKKCHIHTATERYILAARKPEGYAEETERYRTVGGALACLVADFKVAGIKTTPDAQSLFDTLQ